MRADDEKFVARKRVDDCARKAGLELRFGVGIVYEPPTRWWWPFKREIARFQVSQAEVWVRQRVFITTTRERTPDLYMWIYFLLGAEWDVVLDGEWMPCV